MKRFISIWMFLLLAAPAILAQELELDYPRFRPGLDTAFVDFKVVKDSKTHEKVKMGTINKESINLSEIGYNGVNDVTSLVDVLDIRKYDPDYAAGNYSVIVLADRSVNDEQLQAQRQAITELFQGFPKAHFYLTAMDADRTPTTLVQDIYQLNVWLDSCFAVPSPHEKFIYKAVASVMEEVTDTDAHDFYPATEYNAQLKADGTKKELFLMTNGAYTKPDGSYIGGEDFFRIKMALISELNQKNEVRMNVVYFGEGSTQEDFEKEIKYVFKEGDNFFPVFNLQSIKEQLIMHPDPDAMDYRMVVSNESRKLYDGQKVTLHAYLEQDGIDACGTRTFTMGTLIDPIPVQATPQKLYRLLAMCLVLGLVIIGIAFLFFRFLFPRWKYGIFKRRYVKKFEKANTLPMHAKDFVAQKCYYCKDAFQPGEEIVTRCEHTMHYDCWKENGCQCPEYGQECDNGPFFYDEDHPRDKRNKPYFLKWLITGCVFGLLGWIAFRLCTNNQLLYSFISDMMTVSQKVHLDVTGNTFIDKIHDMLFFGTIIGFFVTLGASWLLERRKKTLPRVLVIVGRALGGAFVGFLAFLLGGLIAIVTGKDYNCFIVDIIPWLLMGALLGFVIAYRTEASVKRAVLCGFLFAMIGCCILYLFSFDDSDFEFHNIGLLASFLCMNGVMIFAGGLYACIAIRERHSEHYFLHVDGNLKGRDIAVYKWMNRVGGHRMVTIGRSDRCYVDMYWDQSEGIDGVQAEVYIENDVPYCRILKTNQVTQLSHGSSFRIGSSTFTYIEKDRI